MIFTYSAAQVAHDIPPDEASHVEEDDRCICFPRVVLTRGPDGLLIVMISHQRMGK